MTQADANDANVRIGCKGIPGDTYALTHPFPEKTRGGAGALRSASAAVVLSPLLDGRTQFALALPQPSWGFRGGYLIDRLNPRCDILRK
jgi:hypothetical protein